MQPVVAEGNQSKEFIENKEIVQRLLESVNKQSLEEIKTTIEAIEKDISNKKGAYSQFSDITDILNSVSDGNKRRAIHFVASRGEIDIYDYLLSLGADPNLLDSEKNTSFFISAQHGHLPMLKHIVEKLGQDPLQKRDGNVSAIHLASSNGDIDTISYLLEKGANVQEPSSFGFPINWAAGYHHIKTVEFLISKGASPNGDSEGVIPSPLILSADYNDSELFKLLISHGADVNITDSAGWSVLHLCAEKGHMEFTKLLIENGANPNYLNEKKTPLQLAFEHSHIDLYQYLKGFTSHEVDHVLAREFQEKLFLEKEEKEFTPQTIDAQKATGFKEEGNVLFKNKKYEEAITKYLLAVAQDSNQAAIFTNLAACCIFLKKFKEGLVYTSKAKKVDPEWIKTYFREGEIYNGLEEYAEAAGSFWECLKREPNSKVFKDLFNAAIAKGKVQYALANKKNK